MIKTILVALDGSEHADAALQYALWLAERVRATVVGLHVIDVVSIEGSFLHDISGSLGFEPYLDFSAKMREALREARRALRHHARHRHRRQRDLRPGARRRPGSDRPSRRERAVLDRAAG